MYGGVATRDRKKVLFVDECPLKALLRFITQTGDTRFSAVDKSEYLFFFPRAIHVSETPMKVLCVTTVRHRYFCL